MPKAHLVELYARSLGVIEEARIEFGPGFNVVTGETGAGKTLLLGALELCLGGDAGGSRYALGSDSRAVALFSLDDGTERVFAREATASGRLRASLDAAPSSAELLRRAADEVIVIHGQHDSLALRSRQEIVRLLDVAGGIDARELDEVRRERATLEAERTLLGGDAAARERERDYLAFQCRELDDAHVSSPDELEQVLEELSSLTRLRDAQSDLAAVVEELDGDGDATVLGLLANAVARLPRGAGVDDVRENLLNVLAAARDHVHDLRERTSAENFDEAHLARLEERATRLQSISRKYGGSLAAAVAQLEQMRARITDLEGAHERSSELEARLDRLRRREGELAARLRAERQRAGDDLTERVRRQLPRVALPHATLRFVVEGDDGSDARIAFAPNPGMGEGPLQALASGGELSRVLLALSLETAHDDVVAVFDEVDAGVGGQVAQQIGDCLREVGQTQQVIAVTHLASVAAKAAQHFVIEKTVRDAETTTRVREVRGEERVNEIARMLAGDHITAEARALAQRLLESVP